jgi:hypothetical protein
MGFKERLCGGAQADVSGAQQEGRLMAKAGQRCPLLCFIRLF